MREVKEETAIDTEFVALLLPSDTEANFLLVWAIPVLHKTIAQSSIFVVCSNH